MYVVAEFVLHVLWGITHSIKLLRIKIIRVPDVWGGGHHKFPAVRAVGLVVTMQVRNRIIILICLLLMEPGTFIIFMTLPPVGSVGR